MWIILSVIAAYVWLLRRKKKTKKQQASKVILIILLVFAVKSLCFVQNEEIIISGEIQQIKQNNGEIITFLIDEATFSKTLAGIDTVIVKPTKNTMPFEFNPQKKECMAYAVSMI